MRRSWGIGIGLFALGCRGGDVADDADRDPPLEDTAAPTCPPKSLDAVPITGGTGDCTHGTTTCTATDGRTAEVALVDWSCIPEAGVLPVTADGETVAAYVWTDDDPTGCVTGWYGDPAFSPCGDASDWDGDTGTEGDTDTDGFAGPLPDCDDPVMAEALAALAVGGPTRTCGGVRAGSSGALTWAGRPFELLLDAVLLRVPAYR